VTAVSIGDATWSFNYLRGNRAPDRYLFFGASSIAGTLKPAGLEKAKGLITAGYLKDPTVPTWQDDPGFKEWAAFATKYMSPTDVREGLGVYGFTAAATMVHVLDQMESELGGTLP
jgi:branched-chain amino acid transport system substrate-binding protein